MTTVLSATHRVSSGSTSWLDRARLAEIELRPEHIVVRNTPKSPSLRLKPNVLEDAFGKFLDAYFVVLQNVSSAIKGALESDVEAKVIGMAARVLQFTTCWQIGINVKRDRPRLIHLRQNEVLIPRGGSEIKIDNIEPHSDTRGEYEIMTRGYGPHNRFVENHGVLSIWNLRNSGIRTKELLTGLGRVKQEHEQSLEKFTPRLEPDERTMFFILDGATAHSAENITFDERHRYEAIRWVHGMNLAKHYPGQDTTHLYGESGPLFQQVRSQRENFILGKNRLGEDLENLT